MSFSEQNFILFDVQTTGTNPESSVILEAGWGVYRATLDPLTVDWHIRLLALPESTVLPRHIQKLTGLSPENWATETVVSHAEWVETFQEFLALHDGLPILVHYARFKQPFLLKALGGSLANRVVCCYELARYAMPQLKSHSLRAVAGYAGFSLGDKKRSRDHLTATAYIWRHLVEGTAVTAPDLRQKRLQLPDQPGVYFFIDQSGRILYVGKASSLKARLNSYFRGRKTKGSRLNEMLTRAVDFRTVVVRNELEALLRESDEIKRHDPPYNRLLKADDRQVRSLRWGARLFGPLLWVPRIEIGEDPAAVEALAIELWQKYQLEKAEEARLAAEAAKSGMDASVGTTADANGTAVDGDADAHTTAIDGDADAHTTAVDGNADAHTTAEETDERDETEYLLIRFVSHVLKSRWLHRLAECDISWQPADAEPLFIRVRGAIPSFDQPSSVDPFPEYYKKNRQERLAAIDVPAYDRLTILYNGLRAGVRRGDRILLTLRPGLNLDLGQYLPIE